MKLNDFHHIFDQRATSIEPSSNKNQVIWKIL